MKSSYLNAMVNSCRQTMEMIFQTEWKKTDLYVTDFFESNFPHMLQFQMEGDLYGMFAISFPESAGNEMCNRMTGGASVSMDEFGRSALEEAGNMIKGGIISSLSSYEMDVPSVFLLEQSEAVLIPTPTLVISATSEIGEIQLHMSVFEQG